MTERGCGNDGERACGNDGEGYAGMTEGYARFHDSASVIPDVRNRESMVFPCRPFSSLGVRLHGSYYSAVMLALSKGYDSLIEPRRRMDSR